MRLVALLVVSCAVASRASELDVEEDATDLSPWDLGDSVDTSASRVSNADKSAEAAHKKALSKEEIRAKQIDRWHLRKHNAHANYDAEAAAGKPKDEQGDYATGKFAMNSSDWEKKMGGYPTDMISAEKKQKADEIKQNALQAKQAKAFMAKEANAKKAQEAKAEKARKAEKAAWNK